MPGRVIFVRSSAARQDLLDKMVRAGATVEPHRIDWRRSLLSTEHHVRKDGVRYQIVPHKFRAEDADGFGTLMRSFEGDRAPNDHYILTYGASLAGTVCYDLDGKVAGAARYDMSSVVTYNFGTGRWCVGAGVPHFGGNRGLGLYHNLEVLIYNTGPWEDTDGLQVLMYEDKPLELRVPREGMMSTIFGHQYLRQFAFSNLSYTVRPRDCRLWLWPCDIRLWLRELACGVLYDRMGRYIVWGPL